MLKNPMFLLIVLLLVLVVVEDQVNPPPEPTPEAVASAPAHRAKVALGLAGLVGFGFAGTYLIMRRGRGDSETAVTFRDTAVSPKAPPRRQNRAQKRRRWETGITIDPARFR
jgi:hypothetical protein